MRFWQKTVLTLLVLLTLTSIGGTAALIFYDWPGLTVLAQIKEDQGATSPASPVIPTSLPTATQTSSEPRVEPTSTPFQPLPITPTDTPSPTPTDTPTPTVTPSPTNTPTPDLPDEVHIEGIRGYPQAFNLSCESRSASDLARFFGIHFTELEFLNALPTSDNPDEGFVGSVHGFLGQLPPLGYGVHAVPVAKLMRSFGLDAEAHRDMSLKDLKREIAAGRPVMVWAIKDMAYSTPVEYTANDGKTTIVARYEHTFIVIGYGENFITVLDNERVYSVSIEQFKTSWGFLGNMAITISE